MHAKVTLSTLTLSLGLVACGGGGNSNSATSGSHAVFPEVVVTIPTATYAANSAELGGWTTLQKARVLCSFGALTQNNKLDAAVMSHARYLTNISMASGLSELSHVETITTDPNYTGYNPWDRTLYQGYGNQVAEILAATMWNYDIGNPPAFPTLAQRGADSMLTLLNTVYHLIGAMYDGADVGFGADIRTEVNGSARREEYRFGSLNGYQSATRRLKLGAGNLSTYPCQGSSNIPSAFVPANESPNPFPSMTSTNQRVGPPIYLKVDSPQVLTVTSSNISQGGVSVPSTLMTNANDPQSPKEIGFNEAFVIPTYALNPYTSYQISLTGTIDGKAFSRSFTMSTGL